MFDLAIAKKDLLPHLLMVAGAVDKRQSLAILSNILLQIESNHLVLTATDLEIEISARVACVSNFEAGDITVPAKKIIDILRSLDDDVTPSIKYQSGVVIIKAARSQFKLAALPADQFPSTGIESAEVEFELPKSELVHLLQSTYFAMSQQDVRVFLNGLLLELDGLSIKAVATDGHRMAICKIESAGKLPHLRLLLPRKGVIEMLRLLGSIPDETIKIVAGNNYLQIQSSDYKFTTKLIEARFPPYAKAIPNNNDKFVLIDKDLFKRALSRIIILANEKSRAVLLHLQHGSITLIANNQEQEEAIETIEAQVDGNELKIGINAGYLLDVLNYIPDSTIRLSMSGTDRSILVESLNDEFYQYVIMPMTL